MGSLLPRPALLICRMPLVGHLLRNWLRLQLEPTPPPLIPQIAILLGFGNRDAIIVRSFLTFR